MVVNGINSAGEDVVASAKQGNYFIALIWSAVAILFLSTLTTTAVLCIRSNRTPRRTRKEHGEDYEMLPK